MQIFLQEFYKIKKSFSGVEKDFFKIWNNYFTYICLDPGLFTGTCIATFISIASAV